MLDMNPADFCQVAPLLQIGKIFMADLCTLAYGTWTVTSVSIAKDWYNGLNAMQQPNDKPWHIT